MSNSTASEGLDLFNANLTLGTVLDIATDVFEIPRLVRRMIEVRFKGLDHPWINFAGWTLSFFCSNSVIDDAVSHEFIHWVDDNHWNSIFSKLTDPSTQSHGRRVVASFTARRYLFIDDLGYDVVNDTPITHAPHDWFEMRLFNLHTLVRLFSSKYKKHKKNA